MTRDPVNIVLNTDLKTCELEKNLLQGATNRAFIATLMNGEKRVLLESSSKVFVTVMYNPRMEYGKLVYDGSYVLNPDETNYDVTNTKETVGGVDFTVLTIPFWEGFVAYAGPCKLIINITDTVGSREVDLYSYSMKFTVDLNEGYFPKSIPNNLPAYSHLEARIKQLETDTAATDQKATNNADAITRKADNNLANVGDFASIPDGGVLIKKDGTLKHSDIIIDGNDINAPLKTLNVKEVVTSPNTIKIGSNISLSENGGFLENHTETLNKYYLMLDYENDENTGTKKPIYYERGAKEQQIIQSDSSQVMANVTSFSTGKPTYDRQVQAIYFNFIEEVKNFSMKITVNGKDVAFFPSKYIYETGKGGLNLSLGIKKIDLQPFFSNLVEYDNLITVKADAPIKMTGNGSIPWYKLDLNRITRKNVLVEGDQGTETPEQMARSLEGLSQEKKLSYADGLKDKPVLPITTTDLDDMPKSLVGMKGKMLQVNSVEEGYELVDKPTGGGSTSFIGLTDVPKSYSGQGGKVLAVNDTDNGIEFRTAPDVSGAAHKDLSNVINSDFKQKGIDSGLADNTDLGDVQDEVNRLKTDISTGGLGIFVFRDRGLPVIPTDKQYKAYYIHIIVLQDSTGVINIPANTPNGAIFSVENNDRTDYVNIMPPSGQTINGKTGVYKCDFDTLNFIVKDGSDWKVGFAGVFPNNYDAMKSTIGTLFPNSLHTIPEVEAQLKDRLHTFREIQTEFSTQLHTEQEIKDLQDVMNFDTIANMNKVVPTENKIAIVDNDGNGFVGYYKYNTATSKWENYNAQGVIMSDSNGAIPKLIKTAVYGPGFTIQQAGDQEDAALITYTGSGSGGTEIDAVGDDGKTFKVSKIQSMDGKVAIRNLGGGVADLDADYNTVTDGIFAKLSMDEDINTDFHDQRPYFGDMYDNSGRYIGIDIVDKGFTIQEGDMLDPNVTGGSTFNIGMYFEPLDYNVVSNDGYVELKVVELNLADGSVLGYLNDIDGNPVAIRREYKAGTQVGKELLLGIVRAKGQKKIAFEIDVQFGDQILRASSNTCMYIQEVDKEHNSGICELLFQRHTGYTINKIHRYYGVNNMNLAAALVRDKPQGDMENTSEMMGNGIFFDTRGKCKVEIKDYHIIMQDNGVDLPVFSLGKIWDEIDTLELRLKNLNAKVVITDKQNAFIYALMKWTGTGPATLPILTGYNNSVPVFASGWIKVSQKFISEDVVSGDHTDTNAFTVPNDAKQIAMIIYPNDTEIPTVLKLKDFEVDISPSFTKTIIQNSSHITEEHLKYEKNMYKSTVYTPSGFQSYRYTVNNVDTKLPVGVIKSGDGKIINDNSWSDAGSSDPNKTQGDFKFLTDGEVTIDYQARCFNEQGSINQIQFWLAKVNDNGTFTEVPNSRYASTIEASRKVPKLINSDKFTFDVKANESYRFFGKSDKSDGFFVQSDLDGVPLLEFIIDFNDILESEQAILDDIEFLKEHANEVEFVKSGKPVADPSKYKLKIDVDTGQTSIEEV